MVDQRQDRELRRYCGPRRWRWFRRGLSRDRLPPGTSWRNRTSGGGGTVWCNWFERRSGVGRSAGLNGTFRSPRPSRSGWDSSLQSRFLYAERLQLRLSSEFERSLRIGRSLCLRESLKDTGCWRPARAGRWRDVSATTPANADVAEVEPEKRLAKEWPIGYAFSAEPSASFRGARLAVVQLTTARLVCRRHLTRPFASIRPSMPRLQLGRQLVSVRIQSPQSGLAM